MNIDFDQEQLRSLCEEFNVERLHFFGSVLRDDFSPESDVDVLVEFPDGEKPGLFLLGRLQQELTELLGRTVDLKTPEFFDSKDRETILAESTIEYDRAA